MDRNRGLDAPAAAEDSVESADESTRWNSDVSSLTAENCRKDSFQPFVDVNPASFRGTPEYITIIQRFNKWSFTYKVCQIGLQDDYKRWTDEKHNLYLNQLEVSFVKQLHQSKGLFVKCSDPNRGVLDISQKWPVNVHSAFEQNGCWQKINYERDQPLSHPSPDSCNLRKRPSACNSKRTEKQFPASRVCKQHVHEKGVMPHGLAACPQQYFSKNLMKEGVGQNFVEEDNPYQPNVHSEAKRSKIALSNAARYDQIGPSSNDPTTGYLEMATSNSEEQHGEFVRRNF